MTGGIDHGEVTGMRWCREMETVVARARITIKLDRLIVLSKSSLLVWFLHVSLIVIIKGRSPMEVSLIVIFTGPNR